MPFSDPAAANRPAPAAEWLSLTTAAARYDVNRKTLRRMISRGELPASRLGARGDYRVRVVDIEAAMRPARVAPKGAR